MGNSLGVTEVRGPHDAAMGVHRGREQEAEMTPRRECVLAGIIVVAALLLGSLAVRFDSGATSRPDLAQAGPGRRGTASTEVTPS